MATEDGDGSHETSQDKPAKKSSAKKSSAKKSSAKRSSTAKRPSSSGKRADSPRASAPRRMSGGAVAERAARQLLELTGREAEGVTGLQRTDDGWRVKVEVVELRGVPETTDLLALYEVDVDPRGDLQGYRRLERYSRGAARED
jgi:hypothetical protein